MATMRSESSCQFYMRPVEFSLKALDPIADKLNSNGIQTEGPNDKFGNMNTKNTAHVYFIPITELNYFK